MSTNPNFYHTVHLKDYQTIEEAVNIVKSLVKPEFAKHVTEELVMPVWHDPTKRELPLSNLQTFFNNRAKAIKEVESLEAWAGMMVGGRDIKKYDTPVEKVRGQNHLIVLDSGEISSFSGWGHNIGPPGSEVRAPTLQHVIIKVAPRKFKYRDGREGLSWDGKYVAEQNAIPPDELKEFLLKRAIPLSLLDSEMKYHPVLVRGKIGVIMPLERWIDGDELEEVKDSNGNTIYERNKDGTVKVDGHNRPIPRMRYKRVTDNIGHPLKHTKADGSNETQWVFKVSLYDEDDSESGNRVSVQFQNTKMGDHHVVMPNASLLLEDAAKKPVGGREDGFSDLSNLWGTKDIVVAGTVISVNEREDASGKKTTWFGIDGTLMLEATPFAAIGTAAEPAIETTQPTAPVAPAAPIPSPEDVAAIASDVGLTQPVAPAPPTAESPDALVVPPAPIIPPVSVPTLAPPPAPTVAQPVQQPMDEIELLKRAIGTAMGAMGDDIDYQMVMSLNVGMPEKFKHESQRQVVLAFMQMVRNERAAVKAGPVAEIVTEAVPGDASKIQIPGQPEKATVSVDQILAATADTPRLGELEPVSSPETNIQVVPSLPQTEEKLPPGYTRCGRCQKILSPTDIMTHEC